MRQMPVYFAVFISILFPMLMRAQPFTPVTVTGFNQDVVAETGTSSLTTTTMALDGTTQSNKVMYTLQFRANMGFTGGGIPNNGTITNGADTYQMAAYNGSNALIVQRNQNADLTLAAPASYNTIRVLCFSTEGASLLAIRLHFTDGSNTLALPSYTLGDWFNNTANLVLSGIGRCTRATPATGADGFPNNPRMYYLEISLNCADRVKNLQRINFANNTTAGTNAPFPNAVFVAVSGRAYSRSVQTSSVSATCATGGSATVNVSGSAAPYTVSWNTSPVQTGATATNLAPGIYTATITEAGGCTSTAQVTVGLQNNLSISPRSDTSICFGASFSTALTSNAAAFSWSPATGVSNAALLNPVFAPATTTTYTLTATQGPCTVTRSFTVAVAQAIAVNAGPDVSVYQGQSTQLNGSGPSGVYAWTPPAGLSAANIPNPIATPAATTTYTFRITTPQGCTATDEVTVRVIPYCIKVMNAFTPNGDGINDRWLVSNGPCLTNSHVTVYNRYGSLVYESADYKNDWDGTYKGKPVPDGTYYYKIVFRIINGQREFAQGDVTVIR
jgi:gliding motility-associated-like protein